jgi:MoxR-vWA-beta-propeller ternary system domain bpX4
LPYHFYNTIYNLRQDEEIVLYDKVLNFLAENEQMVKDFLQIEYEVETLNYPFTAPKFDAAAALWGAKTTYTICQLILYRENKVEELQQLLPSYTGEITAAAILSADLCLRFLPQVLKNTRSIDPDDTLIAIAENHLQQWHYSGIGYPLTKTIDLAMVTNDKCLAQLYADRVIQKKDMQRAQQPLLHEKIKAIMGIYSSLFWKELNSDNTHDQH